MRRLPNPIGLLPAVVFLLISTAFGSAFGGTGPVHLVDDTGAAVVIDTPAPRTVSLVPSITEILFAIGAGDAIVGCTHHSALPAGAKHVKPVGGFFAPSVSEIAALDPDVVFYAALHHDISVPPGNGARPRWINLETRSLEDSFRIIQLLGRIYDKSAEASALVARIRSQLSDIRKKTARIPPGRRLRVIRLMGRDQVMTPGDDSFQAEMIRAAGGIPPVLHKRGEVVSISESEWRAFNPQFIYGCAGDRETAQHLLQRPGWKDVDAVRNGRIRFFPCDLTCRASTNTGDFVSWLSSLLYSDRYSDPEQQIHTDAVTHATPVVVGVPYMADARIVHSRIHDFTHKTVVLDFDRPLRIVSTLEGARAGVRAVGNHYMPPPSWHLDHAAGLETLRETVYRVLGKERRDTAFLFTGADVDHVSIQKCSYREMTVFALVTAGVKSNAVRTSKDDGRYYEPGTINVILLTNMALSNRAMTRAIITATEAKTAALEDLDVRSSYQPQRYGATGTGTDNIIVVAGAGVPIDTTGGHSKMGELMATAVHAGVIEAVARQNRISLGRHIFQRLRERRIDPDSLQYVTDGRHGDMALRLERALLVPANAGFMEAALAVSDAYESGRLHDLTAYRAWCRQVAQVNAGGGITEHDTLEGNLPVVLKMALTALLGGVAGN